jgi:hypothetical protein
LADLVERQLNDGPRTEGNAHGVVLLSGPDDEDTIDLERVIVNDTKTASGRPWAWTLSQRYTRLDRLRSKDVTRTSDL